MSGPWIICCVVFMGCPVCCPLCPCFPSCVPLPPGIVTPWLKGHIEAVEGRPETTIGSGAGSTAEGSRRRGGGGLSVHSLHRHLPVCQLCPKILHICLFFVSQRASLFFFTLAILGSATASYPWLRHNEAQSLRYYLLKIQFAMTSCFWVWEIMHQRC